MNASSEQIARARQMYRDGATVRDICRTCDLNNSELYYWLGGGPPAGPNHLPPIALRRAARAGKSRPRRMGRNRVNLVGRLWRAAEAQVRDIEERLARHGRQPDDRAQDAKTFAVLVKTMRELWEFDQTRDGAAPPAGSEHDDDAGPRDLDEFRRELARRMDAIVAARTADVPGDAGAK